jgi:hypothetical protein
MILWVAGQVFSAFAGLFFGLASNCMRLANWCAIPVKFQTLILELDNDTEISIDLLKRKSE